MPAVLNATRDDEFDAVLVEELESLRNGERDLQNLYGQLRSQPQLRDRFVAELWQLQRRADRLMAVLNPLDAFDSPSAFSARATNPAA